MKTMTKMQLEKLYPQPGGIHKDYTLKQLRALHRAHTVLEKRPREYDPTRVLTKKEEKAMGIAQTYEHECMHWGADPMTAPMTDKQARSIIAAAIGLAVTIGPDREEHDTRKAYEKFLFTMEEVFPGSANNQ
jgi:hypothetical protein